MRTRGDSTEYRPRLDITDSLALESDIVFGTRYISKKRNSAPSKVYHANIPPQNFAPKMKKWEKRKAAEQRNEKEKSEISIFYEQLKQRCITIGMTDEEIECFFRKDKALNKKSKLWERSQKKR